MESRVCGRSGDGPAGVGLACVFGAIAAQCLESVVKGMNMILTPRQRKTLESLAHDLEPIVRIGKFGVTATLVQTVRENLAARELIKVKILENAEVEKDEVAEMLVAKTGANLIKIIGRIIILYRPNPERKNRLEVPGLVAAPPPTAPTSKVPAKPRSGKPGKPTRRGRPSPSPRPAGAPKKSPPKRAAAPSRPRGLKPR
jgi:RNA-binding protein